MVSPALPAACGIGTINFVGKLASRTSAASISPANFARAGARFHGATPRHGVRLSGKYRQCNTPSAGTTRVYVPVGPLRLTSYSQDLGSGPPEIFQLDARNSATRPEPSTCSTETCSPMMARSHPIAPSTSGVTGSRSDVATDRQRAHSPAAD